MTSLETRAPDIFVSYAREDRALAQRLAQALEQKGFKVWWDWDLIGGTNYRAKIREVIGEAKKAIVLWSRHSVDSAFVIDEASEAKKLGKLVPVTIDDTHPPFGFGDLHTITLREPELAIEAIVAALNDRPLPRMQTPPSRRLVGKGLAAALAACGILAAAGALYWQLKEPPKNTPNPGTQRIALVIGNSNYVNIPRIPNAVRDSERVTEALEKRGFRVIKENNVTRADMIKAVTEFESTLAVVGGLGLFYFAGSAVYIDGEDIMLPVDAAEDREKSKITNGVNLTRLMKEVQSRTTQKMTDNGTSIVYSASKEQVASDGFEGGNSPFTIAFLNALSNLDDELGDTFRRIKAEMEAAQRANPSLEKQTPWFENPAFKFYFNRPERDLQTGVSKILIFDSCRDNPFKRAVVAN